MDRAYELLKNALTKKDADLKWHKFAQECAENGICAKCENNSMKYYFSLLSNTNFKCTKCGFKINVDLI